MMLPRVEMSAHAVRKAPVPVKKKTVVIKEEQKEETFVPLQVQLLPSDQTFLADKEKSVHGVALGYCLQQKEITGVSIAFMHSANQRKSGFSMSVIELCGESSGLSIFIAGGAVKNKGCSIGLWNITEDNSGLQVGLVNQSRKNALVEYGMKPAEEGKSFGFQAGVINYSDGNGVQFGLWNINPNAFFTHFPIINISW